MTSIPMTSTGILQQDTRIGWSILLSGTMVSLVLLATSGGDIGQKVVAMFVLCVTAGTAVRFDIAHPFVWFAGSFTLYSISGPLLMHMGVHPFVNWGGYSVQELDFSGAMDFQFFALLIALLVIGPRRVSFIAARTAPVTGALFEGALPILLAAGFVGIINVVQIVSLDASSKGDVVISGDWSTRLSFAFNIAATALGVYLAKLLSERRVTAAYCTLLIVIAIGVAIVLLIGQRHFLFRAGLVCLLVFHIFHRRISIRSLLLMAAFALILSTALGGYKMALVLQETLPTENVSLWESTQQVISLRNPEFLNNSPLMQYVKVGLVAALGSEAMTPGNNMAMILSRVPQDLPYFYGSTLPGDLFRSILPGFIIAPYVDTTATTYNALVFPETAATGSGVGFTIAGYGYIHFGELGLLMIMLIVGGALRMIYIWAGRTSTGLMFYIGFFPVAVYVARNDITGPLSQGLKHVQIPLLMMIFVAYLRGHRRPGTPRY